MNSDLFTSNVLWKESGPCLDTRRLSGSQSVPGRDQGDLGPWTVDQEMLQMWNSAAFITSRGRRWADSKERGNWAQDGSVLGGEEGSPNASSTLKSQISVFQTNQLGEKETKMKKRIFFITVCFWSAVLFIWSLLDTIRTQLSLSRACFRIIALMRP